jgi:hypothetical protein
MIAVAFLMFVGIVALSVIALVIVRSANIDYEKRKARLHEPDAETLVYDVPHGEDVVDVTIALAHAGYPSVEEVADGTRHVVVLCPHGRADDRARVRAVIELLHPAAVGDNVSGLAAVRFADER